MINPVEHDSEKYPWMVWCPAGFEGRDKRRPEYFETKNAAKECCKKIETWRAAKKSGQRVLVPDAEAMRMVGLLHSYDIHTFDELSRMLEHWRKVKQLKPALVSQVVEEFRTWKTPKVDPRTAPEMGARLNLIESQLGNEYFVDLDNVVIERFLDSVTEGWSRKHAFKWLKMLFTFARKRRYVVVNPLDEVEAPKKPKYKEPVVYSEDDIKKVLAWLRENDPEMVPTFVLQAFNFIRNCELVGVLPDEPVLLWEDFLDTEIKIRPEVAKQSKNNPTRYIPYQEIVKGLKRGTGPVCPVKQKAYYERMGKAFEGAGVQKKKNALRHSVISYYLSKSPKTGAAEISNWSGNSEAIIKSNYRSGRPQAEGEAWFSIR